MERDNMTNNPVVLKAVENVKAESAAKGIELVSEHIVEERGVYPWSYAMVFRMGSRYLAVKVKRDGKVSSKEINKPQS
jgi:hypothetical protein